MVEKHLNRQDNKQIIANDSKLTSGQFSSAYPKISTSTLVLKQTKIIDPLFFLQKIKTSVIKTEISKTDNLFRGKNQNR
jgi:hypothetical protein